MVATYRMASNVPHLSVLTPWIVSSYIISGLVCMTKKWDRSNGISCLRLDYKTMSFLSWLFSISLRSLTLGKANYLVEKSQKAVYGEANIVTSWDVQPTVSESWNLPIATWVRLGKGPSAPVKPSDDYNSSWNLDYNLMRDSNLEPSS